MPPAFDQQTQQIDPQLETARSSQQDAGFAALVAPNRGGIDLRQSSFDTTCQIIRDQHRQNPHFYRYHRDNQGLTFPSPLSLLRDLQLAEANEQLQLAA